MRLPRAVTHRDGGAAQQYGATLTRSTSDGGALPVDAAMEASRGNYGALDYRALTVRLQWHAVVAQPYTRIAPPVGVHS